MNEHTTDDYSLYVGGKYVGCYGARTNDGAGVYWLWKWGSDVGFCLGKMVAGDDVVGIYENGDVVDEYLASK